MCAVSDLKILLTRQQIDARVKELGAEITRDFSGQSVIFVGVLKGAAIFLSDLARNVALDSTFDFIGSTAFVIRKSSLLSGGPIAATAFRQLSTPTLSGIRSPQGANNDDPGAT